MAEEEKAQAEDQAAARPAGVAPSKDATEGKPPSAPSRTAPPLPADRLWWWGTGRRKHAVARVRLRPGTGQFRVNKREIDDYFTETRDRQKVVQPLETVRMRTTWDVFVNVGGGGYAGQAGAICLGLARALAKAMPELESALRDKGMLTRDARMSERKKYGQKGARKRFQFSKR